VVFYPSIQFNSNGLGGLMRNVNGTPQGIDLLLEKCRNEFRRPENTDYYAEQDYKEAERKFVKFCLLGNPDR
jgi:hypothetical protein